MPSNLSPSREAVQAALNSPSRERFSDDIAGMLAAAYAIDVAPLVKALRQIREFGHDITGELGNPNCAACLAVDALAVLARSQEPQT